MPLSARHLCTPACPVAGPVSLAVVRVSTLCGQGESGAGASCHLTLLEVGGLCWGRRSPLRGRESTVSPTPCPVTGHRSFPLSGGAMTPACSSRSWEGSTGRSQSYWGSLGGEQENVIIPGLAPCTPLVMTGAPVAAAAGHSQVPVMGARGPWGLVNLICCFP